MQKLILLFCIMYKFHNSYFVIFVNLVILGFLYFIYFYIIYIFILFYSFIVLLFGTQGRVSGASPGYRGSGIYWLLRNYLDLF